MSKALASLRPPPASRQAKKRVGRGSGSGLGKTCGRGQGGQTSRSGRAKGIRPGFEGGQMPLQRRLPKRGFINPFRTEREIVNIRDLATFDAGSIVGPDEFLAGRMVSTLRNGVKVLGVGEVNHALTVRAHAFSVAARKKIEAAGGTVEVISVDTSTSPSEETQKTSEQGS